MKIVRNLFAVKTIEYNCDTNTTALAYAYESMLK